MAIVCPGRRRRIRLATCQQLFDPSRRLAQPLLVFDQRNPHKAFALLAKAYARRDRDMRFRQQPL